MKRNLFKVCHLALFALLAQSSWSQSTQSVSLDKNENTKNVKNASESIYIGGYGSIVQTPTVHFAGGVLGNNNDPTIRFNTGDGYGLFMGAEFGQDRFGKARFELDYNAIYSNVALQGSFDPIPATGRVQLRSMMFGVDHDVFPFEVGDRIISPYIGGGVGFTESVLQANSDFINTFPFFIAWSQGAYLSSMFNYFFKGGVSAPISQRLYGFAEYRWVKIDYYAPLASGDTAKMPRNQVNIGVSYDLSQYF